MFVRFIISSKFIDSSYLFLFYTYLLLYCSLPTWALVWITERPDVLYEVESSYVAAVTAAVLPPVYGAVLPPVLPLVLPPGFGAVADSESSDSESSDSDGRGAYVCCVDVCDCMTVHSIRYIFTCAVDVTSAASSNLCVDASAPAGTRVS